MNWRCLALRIAVIACLSTPAMAHETPLSYIGLQEGPDNALDITTKSPKREGVLPLPLQIHLTPACSATGSQRFDDGRDAVIRQWRLQCPEPLNETTLRIAGLDAQQPNAIVHVRRTDGREDFLRVHRFDPVIRFDDAAFTSGAVGLPAYFGIGVEHILSGPDHLLFVLCLLLIIWRGGMHAGVLIGTITAFTLAHSLTLGLAVVGAVRVPAGPVEAVIALSILLLAVELAGMDRRRVAGLPPTLSLRYPWLVAFVFGLLHGFGFAGALMDIGLPDNARLTALLLFNLGVEAGQVLFLLVLAAVAWLINHREWLRHGAAAATTFTGAVASFWLIERLRPLIGI